MVVVGESRQQQPQLLSRDTIAENVYCDHHLAILRPILRLVSPCAPDGGGSYAGFFKLCHEHPVCLVLLKALGTANH